MDAAAYPIDYTTCQLPCKILFVLVTVVVLFLGMFFIFAVMIETLNTAFRQGTS